FLDDRSPEQGDAVRRGQVIAAAAVETVDAFVQTEKIAIGAVAEALETVGGRPALDQYRHVFELLLNARRQVVQRLGDQLFKGLERNTRTHPLSYRAIPRKPLGAVGHRALMIIGTIMLNTTTSPTIT